MKRSTGLLVLPLMLGVTIGQTQISETPKQGVAPNATGVSPPDRVVITNPRAIYTPDPKFPKKARKGHKKGEIVFSLVVGGDGLPRDIRLTRGISPELDQAALDSLKEWRFAPAMKGSDPVAVRITVEIGFIP